MDSFQVCKDFMEQELLPWLHQLQTEVEGKTAVPQVVQQDRHSVSGYRPATERS
jgi:hypothetical protein